MLLVYTILITTALYFAGSRAKLTEPLHSRYPAALSRFMDCAMCAGAWYGVCVSIVFVALGYDYPQLDDWHVPIVCFFGSAIWTPLLASLTQTAIWALGTKEGDDIGPEPEEVEPV